MIILRDKSFTLYDETDNLKRLKDSDILAEKKKPTNNIGQVASAGVTGAIAGSIGGAAVNSIGKAVKGKTSVGMGKNLKIGGKNGAIVGASLAAGATYLKGRKQAKENAAYNKRLKYAQTQALRREKKDWKTNMTQRDGYSY